MSRRAGSRAPLTSLGVLPAYLVATLVLTWPLARELARVVPAAIGVEDEALVGPFLVGWVMKALSTDPARVFHLPIFHPEPLALAYNDHLIGQAILAAPFTALTGSLGVGTNAVVLISFVASAWAVYRLARLLGVSRGGAFLSGWLFAFSPFRFGNLSFLNQVQTQFLPLGLFFALRFAWRHRRRDLAGTVAAFVAQCWSGWYYAFHLALALGLLALHARAAGWTGAGRGRGKQIAVAAIVAGALVLPVLLPYLELRAALPGYRRTLGMTALFSADLLDYFRLDRGNLLLGRWPALTTGLSCWPGLVTVILAGIGIGGMRRSATAPPAGPAPEPGAPARAPAAGPGARGFASRSRSWARDVGPRGYLVVLGVAGFVGSLGPVLHVAGQRLPVPLPYAALYFLVPGLSALRGAARLAVLFLLAAAVLAGFGHDRALRGSHSRGARAAALAGWLGLAILTGSSAIGRVPFPPPGSMPPAYEWLARQPGSFAIEELPLPATEREESGRDALRQLYILRHGRPSLDGTSGFVPPAVARLRRQLQRFPDTSAVRVLAGRGARYLVVHLDELEPARRAAWSGPLPDGLEPRARFGNDLVLELTPRSLPRPASTAPPTAPRSAARR